MMHGQTKIMSRAAHRSTQWRNFQKGHSGRAIKFSPSQCQKGKWVELQLHFPQAFTTTFTFILHKLHYFIQEQFWADSENGVEF